MSAKQLHSLITGSAVYHRLMETFLVGGAVRDQLLGRAVVDRDWVVTGTTPADMLDAGFKPVGRDFPVFLHPETHEEYALARTERKSGPGYHGFVFDTEPSVTLEDDLGRRDLTINAMAMHADGTLIDPYGGARDLDDRKLRHVSPAFAEDPVRVLRVARFMARFAPLGFTLADETLELMQAMATSGEIDHLVAERVWQELERALGEPAPRAFIETLRASHALSILLPDVHRLFGVPQPPRWHPEIDTGLHTLMVMDQALLLAPGADLQFSALCHDLGKGTTPEADWPSHHGHEERGSELCDALCARLRAPKRMRDLAVMSARWHGHCHTIFELRTATLARLIEALDTARRPERFERFLLVCEADARGRSGFEQRPYPQAAWLRGAATAFHRIDAAGIAREARAADPEKVDVANAIRTARLDALTAYRRAHGDAVSRSGADD